MTNTETLYRAMIECKFPTYLDWKTISSDNANLSNEFIREYADKLDWDVMNYNIMTEDFIYQFADKVNWVKVSMRRHLSTKFARKFQDKLDWDTISINSSLLNGEFIREFKDKLNLDLVLNSIRVPLEFIDNRYLRVTRSKAINWELLENYIEGLPSYPVLLKYRERIDWYWIDYMLLSIEDIDICSKYIDWEMMLYRCIHDLPISFVIKHRDKIADVFKHNLNILYAASEEIIEEFKDYIRDWNMVFAEERSMDFIRKYSDKISRVGWKCISEYDNLTEEFIEEFADKLDWTILLTNRYSDISIDFIKKYVKDPSKFD